MKEISIAERRRLIEDRISWKHFVSSIADKVVRKHDDGEDNFKLKRWRASWIQNKFPQII